MSTTQSASHVARDPQDLYDILILRSPTRCATCHQRIRDKHDLSDEESHDGLGTGNRPDAVLERAGKGVIGHDDTVKDAHGAARHYHARTYCADCGRPSGRTPARTADLDTMLERIPALLDCLATNDIAADAETMYRIVRSLKQDPDHAGRTTDIWRTATALAVKHA